MPSQGKQGATHPYPLASTVDLGHQRDAVKMTKKTIDLNCDLGESFGVYTIGKDDRVMAYISSANIACGGHAGDPTTIARTVGLAKSHSVSCGAHPGYPDLAGFGRRSMAITPDEIHNLVIYQIGALTAFCSAHQVPLNHVKPHGALYNTAVKEPPVAKAIADAVREVDAGLAIYVLAGPAGDAQARATEDIGLRVIREAFPDRSYTHTGVLVPRHRPNAVLTDPVQIAERALMMAAEGVIESEDGQLISLKAQTLCVHGDTSEAVDLARQIRETLAANDIGIAPATVTNDAVIA